MAIRKQMEPICVCGAPLSAHGGDLSVRRCKTFTDKRLSHRRAASKATRDAGPKAEIIKLLEEKGIRYFRLNSFDVVGMNKGRKYRIVGNKKGTPDILIFRPVKAQGWGGWFFVVWLECKSNSGIASPEQKAFQAEAVANGETYLLVRSAQDVQTWLEANT